LTHPGNGDTVTDNPLQEELLLLRKDGTRFPAEVSSSLFKDKNGLLRTSMIIRDITKRKQAEAALQESEERFRLAF
jgi:PAS domain S-box-containing protein